MLRHDSAFNLVTRLQQASRVEWRCSSVLFKLLALVILSFAVLGLVCQARPAPVHDYIFGVTGVVKSEDDAPLQDAEITLEVSGTVYKAITPVRTVTVKTDNLGSFFFMYISHKRGVKYTVTVHKQGFEARREPVERVLHGERRGSLRPDEQGPRLRNREPGSDY